MIGGPGLAGEALRAGLVDEYHVFVYPVVVGGGKPSLPGGLRARLELWVSSSRSSMAASSAVAGPARVSHPSIMQN